MAETIMVLLLIAAVAALTAPSLAGFNATADDTQAKIQLQIVLDAQVRHQLRTGGFFSAENETAISELTRFAAGPITVVGPDTTPSGDQVSVATSEGQVLAMTTKPGDTCWLVVRDLLATGETPLTWWAYHADPDAECTAAAAINLPVDTSGYGTAPSTPSVI